MRSFGIALLTVFSTLQAISQSNSNILSSQEKIEGWQLLFDGNTLNGWHGYHNVAVDGKWEVNDGSIHLVSPDGMSQGPCHDLVTNESYGDFDLKAEWKVGQGANSGIMMHVQEGAYDKPYMTGPEMQVLDNEGNPNGRQPKGRAGSLYGLIACSPDNARPPGQWNDIEILCKGGVLKFFQNGENVVSTTLWDDNWSQLVAGSSFTKWPDYGTSRSGKIDLQDLAGEVWFRNIKIKKYDTKTVNPAAAPDTKSPVPETRRADNKTLVGLWGILSASPALKAIPIFSNGDLELHSNRVGLSVNQKSNTVGNVRLFTWDFKGDTLFIDTLRNGTQHVRAAVATMRMVGDTMLLHVATVNRLTGKPVFTPGAEMTLQKLSDDEFDGYADYLPPDIAGKWLRAYQLKDGQLSRLSDQYWDIHPSNDNFGEIIMYPVNPASNDTLEGLNFVKYSFSEWIFSAAYLRLNPNKTKSDTTKHYERIQLSNQNAKLPNVYCHYSDGVAVFENEGGLITYLIYSGPARWSDVVALHYSYTAHKHVALEKFGFHVQSCNKCRGSGTVTETVKNSSPDREVVGSEYGRPVYENVYHTHIETNTCDRCEGKGWYDEDDETPVQYDASLKYSTLTGVDASGDMQKEFVKINNMFTASFIKNENGLIACKTTHSISWRDQWLIIPVKGTSYVLFKNRVSESYLCSTPGHGTVFSRDSSSQAVMWSLLIDPNADMYNNVGKLMKILSVANNNEVLYNNGEGLSTGDQWDHLASCMWSVRSVLPEELSQEFPK